MSKEIPTLTVEKREIGNKGANRRLRNEKLVPGIYYDAKGGNIPIVVNEMPLFKLYEKAGSSTMFTLRIKDGDDVDERPSLIWKVQHHPVKNQITHVDFFGVQMGVEMKLTVPFELQGTPVGIKEGGVLELFRETVEIICLPKDIPHSILLDVTELNVNESLNIEDLKLPEGVRIASEESFAVAGVVVPQAQDESSEAGEEEETEGEAGEEEEE